MLLSEVEQGDVLIATHPETGQEFRFDVIEKHERSIFVRGRLTGVCGDWTQCDLDRTGARKR